MRTEITDNGKRWPFRRYGWTYCSEGSYVGLRVDPVFRSRKKAEEDLKATKRQHAVFKAGLGRGL